MLHLIFFFKRVIEQKPVGRVKIWAKVKLPLSLKKDKKGRITLFYNYYLNVSFFLIIEKWYRVLFEYQMNIAGEMRQVEFWLGSLCRAL